MSIEGKKAQCKISEFQCYSGTLLKTITEETLSQIDRRSCSEEVGEEQVYIYMIFLGVGGIWEVHVVKHKAITVNQKNRYVKLMILVFFHV